MRRSKANERGKETSDSRLIEDSLKFSVSDPEYPELEHKFMTAGLEPYVFYHTRTWAEYLSKVKGVLHGFGAPKQGKEPVFVAIEQLALAALRPEQWEKSGAIGPPQLLKNLSSIRQLTWSRIERWYDNARRGLSVKDRNAAAKNLRRVGNLMAGSRKGLDRRALRNDWLVYVMYRQRLFRLQRLPALLETRERGRTRLERLDEVADFCGLPVSDVRQYFRVSTGGEVRRPLDSPERQARTWTAQRLSEEIGGPKSLRITEQTVANIISGSGRNRSR